MRKNVKSKKNKCGLMSALFRAIVVLMFFPVVAIAVDAPGIPNGWSDGFVYSNGIRVHYYHAEPSEGKQVVVMVHGVTDNGLCWARVALEMQDEYDIYMLDSRGHGLSDPFKVADDGETLIKDVVGFVEAMNFEKPILLGHSMGAATVMRIGAEYPDIAKRIIMLDPFVSRPAGANGGGSHKAPPVNTSSDSDAQLAAELSVKMFADPETLVKQNNYSFEDLVEKGTKDNPKWDIVDVKYWALSKKQYHGPYMQEAWGAMSGTMRIGDALSKIQVPALILKADASADGRKANEDAVNGLDNIKLIHVDGAAHNLHHDDLRRTIKEITEFLSVQ